MQESEHGAEVALWRAVIVQAIDDACNWRNSGQPSGKGRKASHKSRLVQRDQAREWLVSNSADFQRVCQYALLDPAAVRDSAQEMKRRGWVPPRVQGRHASTSVMAG